MHRYQTRVPGFECNLDVVPTCLSSPRCQYHRDFVAMYSVQSIKRYVRAAVEDGRSRLDQSADNSCPRFSVRSLQCGR